MAVLLRVAAEAVILQDEADVVMGRIGQHAPLGEIAPIAGPLSRRFFALRTELPPSCADPEAQRLRHTIDLVLYHHAMQLTTAMDFLAVEWRSAELARQVGTIRDLGPVTELLDEVYHDLVARTSRSHAAGDT